MDFSAWLITVILPLMIASVSLIYYYMGRVKEND